MDRRIALSLVTAGVILIAIPFVYSAWLVYRVTIVMSATGFNNVNMIDNLGAAKWATALLGAALLAWVAIFNVPSRSRPERDSFESHRETVSNL